MNDLNKKIELLISIDEEQIYAALQRQVRVALAQLFESKEINTLVKKQVKEMMPTIIDNIVNSISIEETKEMFIQHLKDAIDRKVKIRLKGL